MRQNLAIGFFCLWGFFSLNSKSFAADTREMVFEKEREAQGIRLLQKAEEFFRDRNPRKSLETCKTFLLLYPMHPKQKEVYQLMSKNYLFVRDYVALAENEAKLYQLYPHTEEGLYSYLSAGKVYTRMGQEEKAYQIFQDISKQTFSSKIAQEAEIELTQMEILGDRKKE